MIRNSYKCCSCLRDEDLKVERFKMMFTIIKGKTTGYPVCSDCLEWFNKSGQLIIGDEKYLEENRLVRNRLTQQDK